MENKQQIIVDEIVRRLNESGRMLTRDELAVIRRFIYNIDNIHVFDPEEIKTLKILMDEYTHNSSFREVMKFFVEEYRRPEDREHFKNMLKAYKIAAAIGTLLVWIRNVVLVLTPIVGAWIFFKDQILEFLGVGR